MKTPAAIAAAAANDSQPSPHRTNLARSERLVGGFAAAASRSDAVIKDGLVGVVGDWC